MITFRKTIFGFALLELLLGVGIATVLTTFGTATYLQYRNSRELDLTAQRIAAHMRSAIFRSVAQEFGGQWGIRFENGVSDFYVLWRGADYASAEAAGTLLTREFLPSKISFLDPVDTTSKTVVFIQVSGIPSEGDFYVTIKHQNGAFRVIEANALGKVAVLTEVPPAQIALDASSSGVNVSSSLGSCSGGVPWSDTEICVEVPDATFVGSRPVVVTSSTYTSNSAAFTVGP
ncbi:MAG: hypothetical protein A3F24_02890 [Candidatus Colwellbacteria bacterium RIFCSPHIGHO2_12_FULL_44_17]|uniref:Prepilin-type N-terminal cleavage/methylation domain-containing protein n=1 Tax=Candidatus Colwellbacteria bacterium RIFCSPHIGHO2_12_FULL_44_17 TaxID=1797689 RepID=A0A1G1Z410_9BACT|nr:MAG: hypothetical protein A3F24_02890 [Candidatus Colwellbacteria bacterium RIFCSPHIGHO2_12_FULL_44_17]